VELNSRHANNRQRITTFLAGQCGQKDLPSTF
jgi:hypothetical protein